MAKYILKKLANGLLVLFGAILVVFFLFHTLPGDPVDLISGQNTDLETREQIRHDFGLDKPLTVQLLLYFSDLSPISVEANTVEAQKKYQYTTITQVSKNKVLVLKVPYLRRSFQSNKRVNDVLAESLPGTLWLAFASILFATSLGIFFGMIAALYKSTFWDHFLVTTSVMGISLPSFVAAILMSIFFGYYMNDIFHLPMTGSLWEYNINGERELHIKNIILPSITLGLRPLSIITQLTRGAMLEVVSEDYIRTAIAKGLKTRIVIFKHALKNALNPVITAVSGWLAAMMTGAFFVEYIFKWKGIGLKTIQAVEFLDLPVVIGSTIVIACVFIIINLVVDILYAVVDPRVRLN